MAVAQIHHLGFQLAA
ncbi:hypothetical protein VCHC50A1_1857, partial [Vibrio cholerae HC-50A1]